MALALCLSQRVGAVSREFENACHNGAKACVEFYVVDDMQEVIAPNAGKTTRIGREIFRLAMLLKRALRLFRQFPAINATKGYGLR